MSTSLLPRVVDRVQHVPGVAAIVLGGSRARGTHTSSSDYDLGIYYSPRQPIDITALAQVAAELDDTHSLNLVTEIGGWGPWIN